MKNIETGKTYLVKTGADPLLIKVVKINERSIVTEEYSNKVGKIILRRRSLIAVENRIIREIER